MPVNFRFAIVSDLHIALPHTILEGMKRFHLVEVSIPALEVALTHLERLDLDFLLLPGDLTQDGELDNHVWLSDRLARLPFPVYVIPGNHDLPLPMTDGYASGLADFPHYYRKFGYENPQRLYYTCEVLPGVRLIALNSNAFDRRGQQLGILDEDQVQWLEAVLAEASEEVILVMVHHNVIEHLPGQSQHSMGRRYMLENGSYLQQLLRQAGVRLVLTGHLHVQDIAEVEGLYEITTGSLVSYPHPYRILEFRTDAEGRQWLQVESHRVTAVPGWSDLSIQSREWMGDRSLQFMLKLLMEPPLSLPRAQAEQLAPSLRYFWSDIAGGDAVFDFEGFPPMVRRYFQAFSATAAIDNEAVLLLKD